MSLAMSIDEREQFLSNLHVGLISIPRSTRGPLTVPIWYAYEPGGNPWMITDSNSLKGRCLEKCDRISLCVQTEELPYQYVMVEGEFQITKSNNDQLLAMAIRYLGPEQGELYAASDKAETSIIVTLIPDQWLSTDYSKQT
ncbi:MAG: nitroimidazol reductase NimA-like FMN-containing flavoprotein [Candidatus Azotimanducaceae bacterium]|jgi:nitroimidazol reductase NimA-like FMN-containing flavoprotein (pyridoxamine 5'-phosphate oxidase superfamily)